MKALRLNSMDCVQRCPEQSQTHGRTCELRFFKHELVYLHFELDVVFGLVLPGWRKDCVGLA